MDSKEIIQIPLNEIIPNRFQPRLTFDIDALNDLARSIKEHGIIQPLVVRKVQDKYEIIAGERRFKAASMVGLSTVPCIIMNLNDGQSAEIAIVENIQRKEMTPLEEARSFKKLLDKGYLTQEDLAKKMGKSQSSIANKLRLLNLDEVVQDAILSNKISERHARSLLRVQNKTDQRNILAEIIQKRLTVKQTDELINQRNGGGNKMEINNSGQLNNIMPKVDQAQSVPSVKLPTYSSESGTNPQLRVLNSIGEINEKTYEEPTSPEKVELPNEETNPALSMFKDGVEAQSVPTPEEVKPTNMIDPSKLNNNNSETVKPLIKEEPIDFNLDVAKDTAQDIKPKEIKADIESLLHTDNPPKQNKFLVGINKEDDILDVSSPNPVLPNEKPQYNDVKAKIIKEVEDLKLKGAKVYKEEADFGNTYQIIIRIDK